MKTKFFKWLMRFAYRQIKIAQPNFTTGIPGMRDPESECSMYSPRKRVAGDMLPNCVGDGHYLCKECAFSKFKPNNK